MVSLATRPRYSLTEYLLVEQLSPIKHEFLDGEIFAMAGGTPEHAMICANVIATLHRQLLDGPCRVYSSDLRVRVQATGLLTYPDASVVCGPRESDPLDPNSIVNPTLLVEVLSPSTADYDRNGKLEHYRTIPSLRELVLVDHAQQLLQVWRRGHDGLLEHRSAAPLVLASVSASLTLADVYRGL